ncbi:MAG: hypothetical protein JSW52_10105 [Candidatus Coatesbacteria bacterium]|nr:MAG: hypothetical protein JSW52_10105 [Candidatus Coatesbacteria bacterium]
MKRALKSLTAAAVFASAFSAQAAEFDLNKIREDLATMNQEWAEEIWNADAYGEEVDRASIMAKYPYLSDNKELVDFVKAEYEAETDPVEKRRLRLLYWDISGTYMFEKMVGIYDEMDNTRAGAVFYGKEFDEPVAYRDLWWYYNNLGKDELDKRAEIYFVDTNFVVNVLNPMHRKRIDEIRANCDEIGFDSYTAYDEYTTGFDHAALTEQAYKFLGDTQEIYEDIVTQKCREVLGKGPSETVPWERGIIWHKKAFDEYFPADEMLPFTYGYFAGLGLDLRDNPNIMIDDEDRERKEPRAASYSISVPDDIRINLKPLGGMYDYEAALHESGHALHYSYTDAELAYEFRHLGTNSLTETYSFLFEGMFLNPVFLEEEAGMPKEKVNEYMDVALLSDLAGARYYAMNVIYEAKLHGGTSDDPLAFYVGLRDTYGVFPREPYQNEAAYLEVDEEFYSRDYMTAWYAEAQLRAKLEDEFGVRWYKDPAAGEFLKDLFRRGDSWETEDMLRYIGYDGLDSSYLATDFAEMYDTFKSNR